MNCKLLMIDNTTSLSHPWKQVLNANFETREAVGGFEAVTKLDHENFDVVIVNISLKHLNGVDAVRKIREKYYLIPIIVLYKQTDKLNLKQVRAYGIQQALQVPVDVRLLLLSLSKLMPPDKRQTPSQQRANLPNEQQEPRQDAEFLDVEKLFYDGLSAIAAARFREAINIYQSLINLTNLKHEAWLKYVKESFFQLGHCYANLKQYSTSNRYFALFIRKAPRHNFQREALLHMGRNCECLKDLSGAALYYRKVLKLRPADSCTTQAHKRLAKLERKD